VRRTIVAHPGLSPEGIADMIAGKQKRDPREVEVTVRDIVRRVIDGETNMPENKEELLGKIADQAQLDF